MVIDTATWHDTLGPDMVAEIAEAFQVDVVAVMGNERIYSELTKMFYDKGSTAVILQLPKSGGVVEKDKTYRRYMMMKRVREYFYGSPNFELSPYTSSVPFHEVHVRRIPECMFIHEPSYLFSYGCV
jgi:polyribonucleotide 5'-hydroxyl-kinase